VIRLSHEGKVARLRLDRPHVRNALAVEHWEQMGEIVAGLAAPATRLVVVSGDGGAFCSGADIGEFERFQADEGERARFREAMRRGMDALAASALPTLAWIDGPCFGAGIALAMACDMRLARTAARFAITPAKMGIGYPQEDVARLVDLVGPGWAARLLFTGAPIDAATAERIGLVEQIAGEGELEELAAALVACDAQSIGMLKRAIGPARRGVASDGEQDRRLDDLLGSLRLAEMLSRSGAR